MMSPCFFYIGTGNDILSFRISERDKYTFLKEFSFIDDEEYIDIEKLNSLLKNYWNLDNEYSFSIEHRKVFCEDGNKIIPDHLLDESSFMENTCKLKGREFGHLEPTPEYEHYVRNNELDYCTVKEVKEFFNKDHFIQGMPDDVIVINNY